MDKMLYTVEYLDDKYDRIKNYVLAKNDEDCMQKFKRYHPDEEGHIVNWQRVDY